MAMPIPSKRSDGSLLLNPFQCYPVPQRGQHCLNLCLGNGCRRSVVVDEVGAARPTFDHYRFFADARRARPEDVCCLAGFERLRDSMAASKHPRHALSWFRLTASSARQTSVWIHQCFPLQIRQAKGQGRKALQKSKNHINRTGLPEPQDHRAQPGQPRRND